MIIQIIFCTINLRKKDKKSQAILLQRQRNETCEVRRNYDAKINVIISSTQFKYRPVFVFCRHVFGWLNFELFFFVRFEANIIREKRLYLGFARVLLYTPSVHLKC